MTVALVIGGPLGALDMMDFNVGDHNAYSKSVLNWIRPKVVVGEGVITLRSFTETGDALLIRPTYRGTLLDEYILVEWYTPTGLNEKDAREPYAGRYPRQFSTPGLKIYHVDARVARYELIEGNGNLHTMSQMRLLRRSYGMIWRMPIQHHEV